MAIEHRAEAVWYGDLTSGRGTIERVTTGAFGNLPVTWASRAERVDDNTSPEELIAAAHASCFAMAFSNVLAKAGTPPDELRTAATVTFVGGTGITKIALEVEGRVPGIDEEAFIDAAEDAKENCPVSKALTGVPEITVNAILEAAVEQPGS